MRSLTLMRWPFRKMVFSTRVAIPHLARGSCIQIGWQMHLIPLGCTVPRTHSALPLAHEPKGWPSRGGQISGCPLHNAPRLSQPEGSGSLYVLNTTDVKV